MYFSPNKQKKISKNIPRKMHKLCHFYPLKLNNFRCVEPNRN